MPVMQWTWPQAGTAVMNKDTRAFNDQSRSFCEEAQKNDVGVGSELQPQRRPLSGNDTSHVS